MSSELTEFYRKKAEEELGENETRKAQSLGQFRDWIKMQPHIKNAREDDNFLLRFLRVRKYSVMNATSTFENFLISMKIFPQYFNDLDINDPNLEVLLNSGYLLVMPTRSVGGERIVLLRPQMFDTDKYTAGQSFRLHLLTLSSVLEEEETQISGVKYIMDLTNMPLNFLGLFTITDFRNLADLIHNSLPVRQKSIYFVNLPGFANTILQFVVSLLNEKMRKRVTFFKDMEELKSSLDSRLMPKEYGGEIPIPKIVKNMKEIFLAHRENILRTADFEIKVKNVPKWAQTSCGEIDAGAIGSFRKLEID